MSELFFVYYFAVLNFSGTLLATENQGINFSQFDAASGTKAIVVINVASI